MRIIPISPSVTIKKLWYFGVIENKIKVRYMVTLYLTFYLCVFIYALRFKTCGFLLFIFCFLFSFPRSLYVCTALTRQPKISAQNPLTLAFRSALLGVNENKMSEVQNEIRTSLYLCTYLL